MQERFLTSLQEAVNRLVTPRGHVPAEHVPPDDLDHATIGPV